MSYLFQKWARILFTNKQIKNHSDSGCWPGPCFLNDRMCHSVWQECNCVIAGPPWGDCARPSAFSPCLAHPWALLTSTEHPQHRLHLPLHCLASSLPQVQPATGVPATLTSLNRLLKALPASGPPQLLAPFLSISSQPGPTPPPSAGLIGELTCRTGLLLHPLYQRPQQKPSLPSQLPPLPYSPLSKRTKSWASHYNVGFSSPGQEAATS